MLKQKQIHVMLVVVALWCLRSTDRNGMATTEESTAAKLNVQPTDNSFQYFVIDYNGDTKVMTVTYAGQTFTRNLTDWIKQWGTTFLYL